jgi:hypothetical protein
VTVGFRAYENVFDEQALISNSVCSEITADRIERAREYLASNVTLFHPDDVGLARRTYASAALLVQARELRQRRAIGELADLLYVAPMGGELSQHPESALRRQRTEVDWCVAKEIGNETPGREAYELGLLQRADWQLQCPGGVDPAACRVDRQVTLLRRLANYAGLDYEPANPTALSRGQGSLIGLTSREVASQLQRQQATAAQLEARSCDDEADTMALLSRFSMTCDKCVEAIRRACAAVPRATINRLVNQKLNQRSSAEIRDIREVRETKDPSKPLRKDPES